MPEALSPVWSHLTQLRPVRGAGVELFDEDGNSYLDFTSGIGVTNTGHAHPAVVEAIRRQAGELLFGQINVVITPAAERLARVLQGLLPEKLGSLFFSNSGAEAIEAAVKLARHATKRSNVVVFQGSFHGRTGQAMALTTSKTVYRRHYQPLPAGVFVAPFPYAYRYGWDEDSTVDFALRELELLLTTQSAPDETAAFLIEPVLGEGGYVPAPPRFLRGLRRIADQHGVMLIFDEIQTGFGRTGQLFAYQHSDVVPDVLVMAKGLASGLPLSAIAASPELMARWGVGTHGGTYGGGSTVPLAAALATIEVMEREQLPANAAAMGAHLLRRLRALQAEHGIIGDVRGLGLMVGVEFTSADGQPLGAAAKSVQRAALGERLLLLTCGPYDNVVRWIPPLVVTEAQLDAALDIFGRAVSAAATTSGATSRAPAEVARRA